MNKYVIRYSIKGTSKRAVKSGDTEDDAYASVLDELMENGVSPEDIGTMTAREVRDEFSEN